MSFTYNGYSGYWLPVDANGWTTFAVSGTFQNGYNGSAPASGNTMIIFCSSSTGLDGSTEYKFNLSGGSTAAIGDTYTNNGQTFTVLCAISSSTVLVCSGTGAPASSGNLTRTAGSGTNPIAFASVTTFSAGSAGSSTQPYRTILAGENRLRNGEPDWYLLKKGDVWTNEQFDQSGIFKAGKSATEPMVVSSYDASGSTNPPVPNPGTGGAQPLIKTPNAIGANTSLGSVAFNIPLSFFVATGIELYCWDRDPNFDANYRTSLLSMEVNAPGINYVPGDLINLTATGGTVIEQPVGKVLTTQVVSATVNAGGSGGSNGTQTVTGTTGTGTKFQASVTVTGGAITAVLSITVGGEYTTNPTTLGQEPVTGASLTGAKLAVVMGIGPCNLPIGQISVVTYGNYVGAQSGIFTTLSNPPTSFSQTGTTGTGSGATWKTFTVSPRFCAGISAGLFCHHFLVEDCTVRFYTQNIELQWDSTATGNAMARRCRTLDAWDSSGNVSVGIGQGGVYPNCLLEENLADQNGWNPITSPTGSTLNHNWYLTGGATSNPATPPQDIISDLTVRGNINTNDLYQSQHRNGGHLYNNLWESGSDNALNMGIGNPVPVYGINQTEYNVFYAQSGTNPILTTNAQAPDGNGLFYNEAAMTTNNNIFIGSNTNTHPWDIGNAGFPEAYNNLGIIQNNISWKVNATFLTSLGSDTIIDLGGNVANPTPSGNAGYLDPNRTMATYDAAVLGGPGTKAHFVVLCRAQCKDNWNTLLMAASVDDYVRQGFNQPMIGSGYASTQTGTYSWLGGRNR